MALRSDSAEQRHRAAGRCGVVGVVAALICTLGCCLPPILVALGAGAAATGMAGMAGMDHPDSGLLALVQRISPVLLIASIVLVSGALALRRRAAALPALLAGAVLYLSVHLQSDPVVMYGGMIAGYGAWIALFFWTRANRDRGCQGAAA